MRPIEVFVLSPSQFLREGLAHVFAKQAGFQLVGYQSYSAEAFARLARLSCDVAVIAADVQDLHLQALTELWSLRLMTKIVVLAIDRDKPSSSKNVGGRIENYLSMDEVGIEDVVAAVYNVASGAAPHLWALSMKATQPGISGDSG
jgi:DNA-binding NarL/FixJ family response regulator